MLGCDEGGGKGEGKSKIVVSFRKMCVMSLCSSFFVSVCLCQYMKDTICLSYCASPSS